MAAYQPIQMPGGSGDFGDAFDRILRARQASQQAEEHRAEMLLRQQALTQQQQLQNAQISNYQSEAGQRTAVEAARKAKAELEGKQAIIQALDSGKHDLAKQIGKTLGISVDRQAPSVTQLPGNTTMAPVGVDLTAPPAEGEDMQAVFARNAGAIAANAPQAPKEPTGWNINGMAYDPAQTEAATDAEREKLAKRVGGAFEPLGYGPTAAALARGDTGKPGEIEALISQRMKADQADKERRDLLQTRIDATSTQHERENLTVGQKLSEAAKNRDARIAAAQAGGGGARTDQANLAGYKYIDSTIHQAGQELGLPKLNETITGIDLALNELSKPSGAAQIGGRVALERYLRGGPPTDAMDNKEAARLGGAWSRLEGAVQEYVNGSHSPGQLQAIIEEGQAAKEIMASARTRRFAALKGRLANDPALENVRGTVNQRFRQLTEGMGAAPEDIFPGAGNALPPVGAGSVAAKPKQAPTVRERLTGATPSGKDAEERKRRLLMELGGQ